jgi:thiamine-monophosphate kinase
MGATPRWATLALALPQADTRWLAAFSRGFMRLARSHNVDLIGGDTTRGPLNLCVQIMGEVPAAKALRRDGARAGDDVWVSGTLGDAALAIAARNKEIAITRQQLKTVSRRLDKPAPRVALGTALRGIANSAIDISDGLLADLGHICERSGVCAEIDVDALPVSRTLRPLRGTATGERLLLAGGDDYELCFTAPPSRRAAVLRAGVRAGVPVTCVGEIFRRRSRSKRDQVQVVNALGFLVELDGVKGFDHFG